MEPKIVTKDSFKVIGMQYVGDNKNAEIPKMWGIFMDAFVRKGMTNTGNWYGVCDGFGNDTAFAYVAGYEAANLDDIPTGFIGKTVPAGKYAVFTHHGLLSGLGQTWVNIKSWLPTSGLERADSADFELYDERFKPDSEESELDIYVPIK